MIRHCVLLSLVASVIPTTYAQTVPVTARQRRTEEVILNGKVISTHVKDGLFLRTSTGAVLMQWTTIDGKTPPGSGGEARIADPQHNLHCKVDYKKGIAHLDAIPLSIGHQKRTIRQNP